MGEAGILSLINLSDRESEIFLEYLRKSNKTPAYDFINYMIGENYIKFLDLMAGTNVKVPSRRSLYRDIEYIKIYVYVRDRGFTDESMRNASKIYNKKMVFVRRAVEKMSGIVQEMEEAESEDMEEAESENND